MKRASRRGAGAAGPRRAAARGGAARSSYERIYDAVRSIPRGRVAGYGEVARLAGLPNAARQVGYALHALRDPSDVPWHRVVNARGEISPRASGYHLPQRRLLEREGVRFDARGRIDLAAFGWRGASRSRRRG
jgi:methylated-DNA-protein-cysteine methyltransferase-like protein